MRTPPSGVGSLKGNYFRLGDQPESNDERSTVISRLATNLADSIRTNPKTSVTEISTALTQGNAELKEQLNAPPMLHGNARDRAKSLWRSELMESLKCPDLGAVNSDITPAILEMAIHIYAKKIGVTDLEYIRSGERFSRPNPSPIGQKHGVEKIRLLVDRDVPNHEDLFKAGLHIVLRDLLTDSSVVWSDIKDNVSYTFLKLSENSVNRKPLFDADAHRGLIAFLGDCGATPLAKEAAAGALCNLAVDPANRKPLSDAGLDTSLRSLLGDPKATNLAKQAAAGALCNLAMDPANRKPLSDAGLDKSLLSLLGDPKATNLAKGYANRALDYLKAGSV